MNIADLLAAEQAVAAIFDVEVEHKAELPNTYDYDLVRATFVETLTDAFLAYAGGGSRTKPRNTVGKEIAEALPNAFYRGVDDAGADETDDADEAWLSAKIKEQLSYVDGVFDWLKVERDAETIKEPAITARVNLWVGMLDGVYSEGRLRGAKAKTLVFGGPSGNESCRTCQGLLGKRHTIKWILAHDMIPRPGNTNFECGGWQCEHGWLDPKTGERWTF